MVFFDTPELTLDRAGVVVRARRIQGKGGDSVIKLRPVVPDQLPASLRRSPNLAVEVDAMPVGKYVCSAALKSAGGIDDAREVAHGACPIRKGRSAIPGEPSQRCRTHHPARLCLTRSWPPTATTTAATTAATTTDPDAPAAEGRQRSPRAWRTQ